MRATLYVAPASQLVWRDARKTLFRTLERVGLAVETEECAIRRTLGQLHDHARHSAVAMCALTSAPLLVERFLALVAASRLAPQYARLPRLGRGRARRLSIGAGRLWGIINVHAAEIESVARPSAPTAAPPTATSTTTAAARTATPSTTTTTATATAATATTTSTTASARLLLLLFFHQYK